MSRTVPHLAWARTFEACARHLSFARAADELGLTPAAVGQHVRHLEAQLGFRLFERLPKGIRPTAIGRAYAYTVAGFLNDFSAATVALFGTRGAKTVTLRCAASFASLRLPEILLAFTRAFPEIAVQVYSSIWGDDLEHARIDLEIRYGDGAWGEHDIVPMGAGLSVPACPPGTDFGERPADVLLELARRAPIQILGMENLWRSLAQTLAWPDLEIEARCTVDTSAIALELVAGGGGCAIIDVDLCRNHLARGLIVQPPGILLRHSHRHHLICRHTGALVSPETTLLKDFILSQFV